MIERSRVRIPAGTAGEFSSPGSTFCADSYFGIRSTPVLPATVARKKSRSFCQKCRWQVTAKHACTLRIEPCFGIGHNLSLICQMTSEDIKHQLNNNNYLTVQTPRCRLGLHTARYYDYIGRSQWASVAKYARLCTPTEYVCGTDWGGRYRIFSTSDINLL